MHCGFIDFPLISNMSFLTYMVGKRGKSISLEREANLFLISWKTQNKISEEGEYTQVLMPVSYHITWGEYT